MVSVPMILETPAPEPDVWAEEIKLLYWMVGKETGDPELLKRENILQDKGRDDREKQMDVVRRKAEKTAKSPRRKKKAQESESENDESEEGDD